MTYCMTLLIGWLRPYLSLFVDPYCWMDASIPRISVLTWSIMDGCAHTTYSCIRDINCTCSCRSFDDDVLVWACSHKAFHPSLSLGPHALRGICYTTFFHYPCNPHLAHWRVITVTNNQFHALQKPSLYPFT